VSWDSRNEKKCGGPVVLGDLPRLFYFFVNGECSRVATQSVFSNGSL
jgi:hypothetical protein